MVGHGEVAFHGGWHMSSFLLCPPSACRHNARSLTGTKSTVLSINAHVFGSDISKLFMMMVRKQGNPRHPISLGQRVVRSPLLCSLLRSNSRIIGSDLEYPVQARTAVSSGVILVNVEDRYGYMVADPVHDSALMSEAPCDERDF